mgnify:CR=1 FL=1
MNKLLATVAMIGSMSFAASASADEYATITSVNPNYQNVQVPRYRTDCRVNQVPIYGSVKNGQASTGDTIVGAIIGGAIGNQIGNGSGRDAATVLGAIIGAGLGNTVSDFMGGAVSLNWALAFGTAVGCLIALVLIPVIHSIKK